MVTTVGAALAIVAAAFTAGCSSDDYGGTYCYGEGCGEGYGSGYGTAYADASTSVSVGDDDASVSTGDDTSFDGGVATGDDGSTTGVDAGAAPDGSAVDSGAACSGFASCGAGFACNANKCTACGGSAGPCPCNTNAECGAGNGTECVQNACTPTTNVCHFQSDCASGDVCDDGQCVAACTTSCASGTCSKGGCVPTPVGTACTDDTSCGAGSFCVTGHCSTACGSDAGATACPTGQTCNQGACVTDTRPTTQCSVNADCAGSGQTCLGGLCKYTCAHDADCQKIDNRIGYCAADGVCRNGAEAHPACRSKFDCAPGLDCVDNVCN